MARKFHGEQCKAMVEQPDGSKTRCKIGVWSKRPEDGWCYMHHPKVHNRGGAAVLKVAQENGRKRLVRRQKPKLSGFAAQAKENTVEHGSSVVAVVSFVEALIDEHGEGSYETAEVEFSLLEVARAYHKMLLDHGVAHPLHLSSGAVRFFENVIIEEL